MSASQPRVAYFPDSFHEVNGVAHTSRHFQAFARRRNLPFLCVRAGNRPQPFLEEGNVWSLELPRGFLSFALEKDLRFDPAWLRHLPLIAKTLRRFKPDLIHITGPSEIGMIGAWFAHHLGRASGGKLAHQRPRIRGPPLQVVSAPAPPPPIRLRTAQKIENLSLAIIARFYSQARVLYAPNPELCRLLERTTQRPCYLMPRGVDADLFHPNKRNRNPEDRDQVLGYVGRLSVEKNVALLAQVQNELEAIKATKASAS
jgi:phosphatidylinositol alpha 1,6-mannosyltransferase